MTALYFILQQNIFENLGLSLHSRLHRRHRNGMQNLFFLVIYNQGVGSHLFLLRSQLAGDHLWDDHAEALDASLLQTARPSISGKESQVEIYHFNSCHSCHLFWSRQFLHWRQSCVLSRFLQPLHVPHLHQIHSIFMSCFPRFFNCIGLFVFVSFVCLFVCHARYYGCHGSMISHQSWCQSLWLRGKKDSPRPLSSFQIRFRGFWGGLKQDLPTKMIFVLKKCEGMGQMWGR